MTLHPLVAFAVALVGNALLSLGMVLQKRNIAFIGHKGERGSIYRKNRRGWISGFTLMNIVPVLNFIALLGLPTNVVAAITGSNVAFTALFSALLLGEVLSGRVMALTLFMFASIALAGLRGVEGSGDPNPVPIMIFLVLPLVLAAVLLGLRRMGIRRGGDWWEGGRPVLAVLIGSVAGGLGGFMIVPLKALGALAAPNIGSVLAAPWLWLYLLAGAVSFSIVQLAYKDGKMSQVGPAFYGLQVLWPAIASFFVFSIPFDPVQGLAFAAIGISVVLIAGSENRSSGSGAPGT